MPINLLFTFFLLLAVIFISEKQQKKQPMQNIPSFPTEEPPPQPHHDITDNRRKRVFKLGTTEDTSPETLLRYEQEGYFITLIPFTNLYGENHAFIIVANSEDDYLRYKTQS